jgi:hypothetical protein
MSLDRDPSPREEGWWSSPGLVSFADRNGSPSGSQGTITNGNTVTWSAAKRKSAMVNEHSAFASRSGGLISRHLRSFSNSLPTFSRGGDYSYAEKDKPSTFRESTVMGRLRRLVDNVRRRWKLRYFLIVAMIFAYILFYSTRKSNSSRFHRDANYHSDALLVAQSVFLGRREKVCHHTCGESGRRCHGMERPPRMGY